MNILGIDPGSSGGITSLQPDSDPVIKTFKLSTTERDIADFLGERSCAHFFAYIEKVHAFPKQGVSGVFTFGQSYGFLRGCLIALEIPFEEVSPRKWQSAMGCLSGGVKNVTKALAQQLFPAITVTHAIADSILLAEYGRRVRAGELK